ncbi:hypothetical protein JD844_032092 [Phrynosoma platyrhinos]|uniref:HEAT repeat-containing protein 6 n=1 Tax=Phrynosoma platyrhinos TaxID=52577 RepID=A0ABQ7T453_PHRPL|nr:hypothetical protein JD844_032092 [Phrynosoma platyrhinos]
MVITEKAKNIYGPHVGLNMAFASDPDFDCFDKATQTFFEDVDDLIEDKKANSYTARLFLPVKEKNYVLKTKTKVRERASTIQPKSELGNFLRKEKQKKQDEDKPLEHPHDITLQPDIEDLDEVPEIIDIIYFHLRAIQEPTAREAAIGAVCLLAEKHTEEAISSLLRLSLHCDRHIIQIWEALGQAKQPVRLQVLAKLLEVLKRKPGFSTEPSESDTKFKDNSSLLPLAATKALCIIFRDKKCKVPMNSFYVSVIIFLVIQLHYLMNCSDIDYGQEEILKTSSYISCTMEALKALIKREKTPQTCFTSLTGSWDLLSSPENYLEGVLLLARALVKHHRGLDYAVFTKLLSSESTYTVLQKHYILGLLKNWQTDSSATYRWLSLNGLGNVAHHLQSKKELTALILGILPSFNDPDEKVALTAMEVITKIVAHHKNNVNVYVKITKQLQPFLADVRLTRIVD